MFTEGKYKILYIKKSDGEYYPIGCLTSNGMSETAEMLPTTTRDNADGWTSSVPTKQSYSIPFDGVIFVGENSSIITYHEIRTLKRSRAKIEWKVENGKGTLVDYGEGHFTSLSEGADLDDFITFTGNIVGFNKPLDLECGLVTISDVAECDVFE